MGIIGGLFAASTAASTISSITTANSQAAAIKMQGNYQKDQQQFNAQIADLQAKDATARGNKAAEAKRKETKRMIGAQRAALAAQGIEVNEDTALLIQEDTAGLGAEDVQEIKNNAWREAWGYQVESLDYSNQAAFTSLSSRFNARQTLLTGGLQAANDVMSGAYSYAKDGSKLKSAWNNRTR